MKLAPGSIGSDGSGSGVSLVRVVHRSVVRVGLGVFGGPSKVGAQLLVYYTVCPYVISLSIGLNKSAYKLYSLCTSFQISIWCIVYTVYKAVYALQYVCISLLPKSACPSLTHSTIPPLPPQSDAADMPPVPRQGQGNLRKRNKRQKKHTKWQKNDTNPSKSGRYAASTKGWVMQNIIKTNKTIKILEKAKILKDMSFKFRIKCSKRRTNRMKLSKKHVEG